MREAYISKPAVSVLMDKDGEKKFLAEFNRIGNNINQVAKIANSGELVSDSALADIREQFKILYRFVMRFDGLR